MMSNEFSVMFPKEVVEEWVKERGLMNNAILENQFVKITEITFQKNDEGWVIVEGTLETVIDA